jgi:hypothetical protein
MATVNEPISKQQSNADDVVEVRETPVKTEGEASHKCQLDENMASRHESCTDKLEQQVKEGPAHVEAEEGNARNDDMNTGKEPEYFGQKTSSPCK